jgi:hypothetical protein
VDGTVSVPRPAGVVVAAALQLLLAIAFLVSATVALLYGPAAQAAGEAELLTFICQSIILVLAAVIMTRQVFLVADLEAAFAGKPGLASLDVQALVDAGGAAMPGRYPHAVRVRIALATLGSLVVLILLALPLARAWFRGQPVTVEDPRG